MKICRFRHQQKDFWGVIKGDWVYQLKASPYEKIIQTKNKFLFNKIKLLAPVIPSKIVLAGLNYLDHAQEMNMPVPKQPVIFLKAVSALIGPNEKIIYPKKVKRLDYEAELALVIKKKAKNVSLAEAKKYILGFTCLNDVTARDLQKQDGQWARAKSFDTFCPVGPWIETEFDHRSAEISLTLNNKFKQSSNTSNFIFSVEYLVSFISGVMTLEPGDIISTGTPAGIGPMTCNDIVEVSISGLGTLRNQVARS